MDSLIHPCVPRAFTAAGLVDLNCVKARPGYSTVDGGPAMTSGTEQERDRRDIKPTRIVWNTNGNIVLRNFFGPATYRDETIPGVTGLVLDCDPDWIVAIGTTADFTLGWPR